MLSSNYGRKDPLKFYKVLRNIVGFLLRSRVRFEGTDLIPENGAVVLIANHQNALDPVAVGLALKRPVHFLAKKELFENKFLNWFLTHLLCIPIDRDGMDRAALKKAIRVLDDEGVLGIFPEGTREKEGTMLPFKTGVSFIASQSDCLIVPIGLDGCGRLLKPFSPKARLRVGEPFPYEALSGEKRRETMARITKKEEETVGELVHQLKESD